MQTKNKTLSVLKVIARAGVTLAIAVATLSNVTIPVSAAESASVDHPSTMETILNPDGTARLDTGYTGALDIADYDVTLDPTYKPVLQPAALTVDDWAPLGSGLNDSVRAIAFDGTDVYVGGWFTNAGGDPNADNIAKWDGTSWSALGTMSGRVFDIAIHGTDIYAAGIISAGGDPNANYLAKWDGTSWSAVGDLDIHSIVSTIEFDGSDMYIGGEFTYAGRDPNADYIAKWDGTSWSALGTIPLNGPVTDIKLHDANLYVSGAFTNAGGDPDADYVAKWDGSSWSALGANPVNAFIGNIAFIGTDMYAAGSFTDAGGDPNADYVAKWDGISWSALGTMPLEHDTYTLAVNGTDLYVGGWFTNAGGDPNADYLAKWDGSSWSAVSATPLNGFSFAAFSDTNLYIGGDFTDAGGNTNADHVAMLVSKTVADLTWDNPADIIHGTALSATQLNATANVSGTFTYTPALGTILEVGTHTLHVDFVPDDTVHYANASKDVNITVTRAAPVITWTNPADIAYGTSLSNTQLNATASVPGTFTYIPATGTILNAGTHTLHVDFVPNDLVNYDPASRDVSIIVTQATPVLTWANPADISYGTALSATQLNATASIPGTFTYTPVSGSFLTTGIHTLHVDFVPTDAINYTNASKEVSITVTQGAPILTWANPANISYGTPLSATQLNATADVPGTFTYTPAAGTYLPAGTHTLHVDFVPTDAASYTNTSKDVSITVLAGTIFTDVPIGYWAKDSIERLYFAGVTGGCSTNPLMYCPATTVTRDQMAVFLLRGEHGSTYTPPTATGAMFADVPQDYWAAAWIEQLANEGITGGCGNGNYCPTLAVTRDQVAIFLLRGEHGGSYTPPAATGTMFGDISSTHWAAAWIEQLANEGITGGCGNGNYCPSTPVTRDQMAVFLVRAFSLP